MEQHTSRKERERIARRHSMLEAARAVIAEKGFKHATLDEIAQRAEFGKGTLYNYFPNGKGEMLYAILDDVYDDLHQLSKASFEDLDETSFRKQLHRYVTAFLDYFLRQRDLFVILMKEANRIAFGDDYTKAMYFKEQQSRMIESIEPAIRAAIERGELREFTPTSVAHMIFGNVHGFLRFQCFRRIGEIEGEAETELDAVESADLLCGMLLDGLAAEGRFDLETRDMQDSEVGA